MLIIAILIITVLLAAGIIGFSIGYNMGGANMKEKCKKAISISTGFIKDERMDSRLKDGLDSLQKAYITRIDSI